MPQTQTIIGTLDTARLPLNDKAKRRWADTELRTYLYAGLMIVRRNRPDLFIGRMFKPLVLGADTDVVPLDDQYVVPLVHYVTARALAKNGDADKLLMDGQLAQAVGGIQ